MDQVNKKINKTHAIWCFVFAVWPLLISKYKKGNNMFNPLPANVENMVSSE